MKVTLEEAKKLLQQGNVVAIPTETVYGLAAWLEQPEAIQKIFSLKKRPLHNPLILHVGQKENCLDRLALIPDGLEALMESFWPGPLTIILPVKEGVVPALVRANLATCAFRMPKHPVALELLQDVAPLVAPSANLSGSPSATRAEHVENDFGSDFPVLDGGPCEHGVESTIVISQAGRWQIARLGAISQEQLAAVLGYLPTLVASVSERPICPGQLLSHYAPKADLVLSRAGYAHCSKRLPDVVGFGSRHYAGAKRLFMLSNSLDAVDAAHRLYDVLRLLDQENVGTAWVDMDFPDEGLWKTIRERISRAASR